MLVFIFMNYEPLISVVMSVYNAEKYLREAVDSILNQSFTDFEFIIIDDCSTDGSAEILFEFSEKDDRIRLITNDNNCGLTLSLNKGLRLANGEFIARMDGDDIADVNRFEKQIAYMLEHNDCVVLSGKVAFIDSDGMKLGESDNPLGHVDIEGRLWQGFGSAMVHAAVMFRKAAVDKVGGYRIEAGRSEDLDLYLRLGEVGKLANLQDILLQFRRHCKSVTAVAKKEKKKFLHGLAGWTGLKKEKDSHPSFAKGYGEHSKKAKNSQKEEQQRRLVVLRDAAERRGMDTDKIELFDFPMPGTRGEWHADVAWRAYKQGYEKAARKHSRLAVRYGPFEYLAWRAFLYLGTGLGKKVLARRRKEF